jgi:hypothetical protein
MPGPPTPNLGLTVPTIGGDFNNWGAELNADLAILDGLGAATSYSPSVNFTVPFVAFPEVFVYATGGAGGITVSLPAPATWKGKIVVIKKMDPALGAVIVTPAAGLVDGSPSYFLVNQNQYVRLHSDGVNANVVGNN